MEKAEKRVAPGYMSSDKFAQAQETEEEIIHGVMK